jgi:hypothetical protein
MDNRISKDGRAWIASKGRVTVRQRRLMGLKRGTTGAFLLAAAAMLPARTARALQDAPVLVTLITGDQVVLAERGTELASIRRAPGRCPIQAPALRRLEIPNGALAMVQSATSDAR